MRLPEKASKIARWTLGIFLGALVAVYAAADIVIGVGLHDISRTAMDRFGGDRIEALIKLADCETCLLEERNHAVWALGQFRDERALPVLYKYYDGGSCDHASRICQHELEKAIRWTKGNSFMLPQIRRLVL
jgi:hypothetical protein